MQVLEDWKDIVEQHIFTIEKFLKETHQLCRDYSERNKNRTDIGFNVFTLSSDFYFRENFHSDIIKAFLDPNEKHNEGSIYLNIFIDLLNKEKRTENKLSKIDFQNSTTEREKYRIDILITDEISRKAIIIENKINNASDQKRQLPSYVETVKKEYDIVAIVYLTLNSSKRPDKTDWSKSELEEINQLLRIIPAFDFDKTKPNLFDDWITPSIINSNKIDSSILLRQYGKLIKYLNTNTMDTISLEMFYNLLHENDNLKSAISIKNMLNDLPEYLAIRIEDKYKNHCSPFKSIWRNKQRDTVFEAFEKDDLYLKLDIWCDENGYTVHFWRPNVPTYDISIEFKNKSEIFSGFNIHNNEINNIKKHFDIFEEEKLFEFIDELLIILKTIKEK
jgi:hypothetical protein